MVRYASCLNSLLGVPLAFLRLRDGLRRSLADLERRPPPLTVNYEGLSCKPGTEPGAPTSDVGAYFVLLLALIGGV